MKYYKIITLSIVCFFISCQHEFTKVKGVEKVRLEIYTTKIIALEGSKNQYIDIDTTFLIDDKIFIDSCRNLMKNYSEVYPHNSGTYTNIRITFIEQKTHLLESHYVVVNSLHYGTYFYEMDNSSLFPSTGPILRNDTFGNYLSDYIINTLKMPIDTSR